MEFTILAICTGNICRSPAMDRLLAHTVGRIQGVEVISAGTHAHVGEDMQEPMRRRIAEYGADVEDFVSEQVTAEMIEQADLILAATDDHVLDMTAEVPHARSKMFVIGEFARALDRVDAHALRQRVADVSAGGSVADAGSDGHAVAVLHELVPAADQVRAGESTREDDAVVDPYLMPGDVYDLSFAQIREPVEALAQFLR